MVGPAHVVSLAQTTSMIDVPITTIYYKDKYEKSDQLHIISIKWLSNGWMVPDQRICIL